MMGEVKLVWREKGDILSEFATKMVRAAGLGLVLVWRGRKRKRKQLCVNNKYIFKIEKSICCCCRE